MQTDHGVSRSGLRSSGRHSLSSPSGWFHITIPYARVSKYLIDGAQYVNENNGEIAPSLNRSLEAEGFCFILIDS
jgi:hypothetical protein